MGERSTPGIPRPRLAPSRRNACSRFVPNLELESAIRPLVGSGGDGGATRRLAEERLCRVLFGDSITDFGWYLPYVRLGLACRIPGSGIRAINAGVGGDTVGRAMLRLDFAPLRFRPQRVCVLMGRNRLPRGSYATDEDTPQKRAGIERAVPETGKCLAAIKAGGAEPMLFSLTAYDSCNATSSTNCRYLNEVGFSELNRSYQALAAADDVPYVDLWSEMTTIIYTPQALPFPSDASYAELAACSALPNTLNRESLRTEGLPPGEYALQVNGQTLAKQTAAQLAAGVNLAALETPNQLEARKLLLLMEQFHSGTVPLRKIAASKMIARQEGADLDDTAAIDRALDAWLGKCRIPPARSYKGRKQAVDIYRQNRDPRRAFPRSPGFIRSALPRQAWRRDPPTDSSVRSKRTINTNYEDVFSQYSRTNDFHTDDHRGSLFSA